MLQRDVVALTLEPRCRAERLLVMVNRQTDARWPIAAVLFNRLGEIRLKRERRDVSLCGFVSTEERPR